MNIAARNIMSMNPRQLHDRILAAAQSGDLTFDLMPIEMDGGLTILAMADALKLNGIRVAMSAELSQRVADELGMMLPTAKLADVMFRASRLRLGPFPRRIPPAGSESAAAIAHNSDLEQARMGRQGMVSGWKHWILSPRIAELKAVNYGWHIETSDARWRQLKLHRSASDIGLRVIQPVAAVHSVHHVDYSQLAQFVSRRGWLNGREVDLAEVLGNPDQAKLISHVGVTPARYGVGQPPQADERHEREGPADTVPPSCPRVTNPGERGPGVEVWQRRLVADGYGSFLDGHGGADGIHGNATERATSSWFADRGLDRGRSVCSPDSGPLIAAEIKAANFTRADRDAVKWCVLHSTENTPAAGVARRVAEYFAGKNGPAPRSSAHYVIGNDEAIACLNETQIAWAAPGANSLGCQYEIVGRALKTDWRKECGPALQRAVLLVARSCRRWNVPVRFVDADALRRGDAGITTHFEVSAAFRKSSHVDPGGKNNVNFPLSWFIEQVRRAI